MIRFLLLGLLSFGILSCTSSNGDILPTDIQPLPLDKKNASNSYPAVDAALSDLHSYILAKRGIVSQLTYKIEVGELTQQAIASASTAADLGLTDADLAGVIELHAKLSGAVSEAGMTVEEGANYISARSSVVGDVAAVGGSPTPCYDQFERELMIESAAFLVCAAASSGTVVGPLVCASAYVAAVAVSRTSYDTCVETK